MAQSRKPSRGSSVTRVTALAALLVAWVDAGAWSTTLTVALIGVVAQAVIGYLVPNSDTPPAPPGPSLRGAAQAAPAGTS